MYIKKSIVIKEVLGSEEYRKECGSLKDALQFVKDEKLTFSEKEKRQTRFRIIEKLKT